MQRDPHKCRRWQPRPRPAQMAALRLSSQLRGAEGAERAALRALLVTAQRDAAEATEAAKAAEAGGLGGRARIAFITRILS